MGAEGEFLSSNTTSTFISREGIDEDCPPILLPSPSPPPVVLGLQPSAIVDHVARVDLSLLERIPGDKGGSQPVATEDLESILDEVNNHILPYTDDHTRLRKIAGGSVANTIRGLTVGFGVSTGMVGACGDDDQGRFFVYNMSYDGIDLSRLRIKKGTTAQCACLVDAEGNRTMRPCLSSAVRLQAPDLRREDLIGSKWLVMRYGYYNLECIRSAVSMAKYEGLNVSIDLASFEMVRNYKSALLNLLETGNVDLCFANEDEARELVRGGSKSEPADALEFLSKHCKWAVVTLGSKGCIAKHGDEVARVPAIAVSHATDATGAGDLFTSGFIYGLVKGLSLEECCKAGCYSGASVVKALGGEVMPENWEWMYKQMKMSCLPLPDFLN